MEADKPRGNTTVAVARDSEMDRDISKLTLLGVQKVRRILADSNGNTLLKNAFSEHWPGNWTAASVLNDGHRLDAVCLLVELDRVTVAKRLARGHGKTMVRTVFAHRIDRLDGDGAAPNPAALGEMSVSEAREEDIIDEVVELTGLQRSTVENRLEAAHGRTLVKNLFSARWPEAEGDDGGADDDEDDGHTGGDDDAADDEDDGYEQLTLDELGGLTAARARDGGVVRQIEEATGLSGGVIARRLREAAGKTLVRNVFTDEWPEEPDGGDEEDSEDNTDGDDETGDVGQGREAHRRLQRRLVELGTLLGYPVRQNHAIGGGFRPDVMWYRLDPRVEPNAAPFAVFEIEFGQSAQLSKSFASLKHAHDLCNPALYLIVPEARMTKARTRAGAAELDQISRGAFHEIREHLHILSVEQCQGGGLALARVLGLRLGGLV